MSFIADKQTIADLNLAGKFKRDSVFSFFNQVHTKGGEQLLESMFQNPLTDYVAINQRKELFAYFQRKKLDFPLEPKKFADAKNYLDGGTADMLVSVTAKNFLSMIQSQVVSDQRYAELKAGLAATIDVLKSCRDFFKKLDPVDSPFARQIEQVNALLGNPMWEWLNDGNPGQLSVFELSRHDHFLRSAMREKLAGLMEIIFELDVYMAVAKVSIAHNLSGAMAFPADQAILKAEELRHPLLPRAVGNDLNFDVRSNVLFLTGANMAGKSTLMKAIGINFYLAHMGFPVAAKQLEFSVKEGLFSSINTPDDLKQGYSHFYAEVMRVKNVAEEVATGKNVMVVFDELFKGTNVKDAYEATLAVTEAFALYNNCFFIISTHIVEVGEALKNHTSNIRFKFLPTIVENNIPRYTYKLSEGISSDRQGMMIILNEGILKLLTPPENKAIPE
jgi:DNA mismatch repair protein MutS